MNSCIRATNSGYRPAEYGLSRGQGSLSRIRISSRLNRDPADLTASSSRSALMMKSHLATSSPDREMTCSRLLIETTKMWPSRSSHRTWLGARNSPTCRYLASRWDQQKSPVRISRRLCTVVPNAVPFLGGTELTYMFYHTLSVMSTIVDMICSFGASNSRALFRSNSPTRVRTKPLK